MLIVSQSTATKRAGEENLVKRLVIFSLRSIKVAVPLKKRRISDEIKITSSLLALISLKINDADRHLNTVCSYTWSGFNL